MRIGIDLGGTKIEILALDDDGCQRIRERIDTPQGDYQATLFAIEQLVKQVEQRLQQTASVGVAIPGAESTATGLIKNANSTCLIGQTLGRDLQHLLGREIRLSNDANCFALSEATDGAASGLSTVFAVIVGTGTGGGLVVNGQLIEGANKIAGEWGHNPLPWPTSEELPGPACYCGQQGCIETFLSGPAFTRDYQQHLPASQHVSIAPTAKQIVAQAEAGDVTSQQTLSRYERRMAKSLASVINIIDPDAIVLGGGLSNIKQLYTNVPNYWGEYIFSDVVNTRLLAPMHGDSSGVRGAAWLWPV